MLPVLHPNAPQPTHYQVKFDYGRDGSIRLIPMRVATAEDIRPDPDPEPEPEATSAPREGIRKDYTPEEKASLEYPCPFCEAQVHEGCFARPSFRPLTEYPENPRWVHARRLNLVTFTSPEGAVTS